MTRSSMILLALAVVIAAATFLFLKKENWIELPPASSGEVRTPDGVHDDSSQRIVFSGKWHHDRQFKLAADSTLTYASATGDSFRLAFQGEQITYVYTQALNRGIAEVLIDGAPRGTIDLYQADTKWQASTTFDKLGPGDHSFEVRVSGKKNPSSSGYFVDVDRLIVK